MISAAMHIRSIGHYTMTTQATISQNISILPHIINSLTIKLQHHVHLIDISMHLVLTYGNFERLFG